MTQQSLLTDTQNLFEIICHEATLIKAFNYVKKNKGSPGVDKITIRDFDKIKRKELAQIREELENWSYKPSPVRRVEIPKPGGKGLRLLGVLFNDT